jgi:hypothetical protein
MNGHSWIFASVENTLARVIDVKDFVPEFSSPTQFLPKWVSACIIRTGCCSQVLVILRFQKGSGFAPHIHKQDAAACPVLISL